MWIFKQTESSKPVDNQDFLIRNYRLKTKTYDIEDEFNIYNYLNDGLANKTGRDYTFNKELYYNNLKSSDGLLILAFTFIKKA